MDKSHKGGHCSRCKDCEKAYRVKNRDEISTQRKKQYKKNREKVSIQKKKYYTKLKARYSGLYAVWVDMKTRCYNSKALKFPRYGGRGITVCEEWRNNFQVFYLWAKDKHKPRLQIDRRNNDGNYCPDNCRFVTPAGNVRNSSTTKLDAEKVKAVRELIEIGKLTQKEIGVKFNVNKETVGRIKRKETWR